MELSLSLEKLNFTKLRELHDVADEAGDAQVTGGGCRGARWHVPAGAGASRGAGPSAVGQQLV
jgi:hypothetical protein